MNDRLTLRRLTMALCCVTTALAACARSSASDADIVLLHGKVITVDSADRIAQAIAIKDGKILAVGTDSAIEALAGSATERIDLKGAAVTPGLMDTHMHFSGGAWERMFVFDVSYPAVKTMADVRAVLARRVAAARAGAWVLGRGWDEGKLEERRLITARDIDDVSAGHPVILGHTTGHYLTANSAALAAAKVTRDTKDPPGGTIDRFPDGTPTGVLKEGAMSLVSGLPPGETPEQLREAMAALARELSAEGMTGVKDPGIVQANWDAYQRLAADSALPLRVFALWHGGRSMANAERVIAERAATTKPYESTGDDHVISGGIKLYIDGSGGARTAWMYADWNKNLVEVDRDNRGYPAFSPDTLRALVKAYHDAGFHVSVHSIGDRGIDWTMDSYAAALAANPQPGRRHGIIHANIPTDHALDLMADLQRRLDASYPEPSATFMWWIGDTYAGNFGAGRNARLNPFKTFAQRGIIWAGSSDFPVTPFAARYGLWASVARETMLGVHGKHAFGTAEAVDVRTALKSFTIWPARQMFLEKKVGSIEVGKYADLAVWDRDPYSVPTDELKEMRCMMTLFNGKVVFRREGTGTPP
ncbi:MAG: amidohydrolase [Cytophagaceae bacterium]|nr:amidohydrolase [Gemmatimonadaceae bacterium]